MSTAARVACAVITGAAAGFTYHAAKNALTGQGGSLPGVGGAAVLGAGVTAYAGENAGTVTKVAVGVSLLMLVVGLATKQSHRAPLQPPASKESPAGAPAASMPPV